jgi:multidrug resistance efflux pump
MSNSVAQREYEQAQYSYTSSAARIKRLEASLELLREGRLGRRENAAKFEVAQAQALFDKAKWRHDNCEIRAPVDGIILSKKAEEGNIVNPSAFSSGISASLCDMADLTKLEVDLSIQERDIAQIKQGMPCLVMPEAYQADKAFLKKHPKGYEAFVSRLMPTADRAKGAIPVRVQIANISKEEAGVYLRPEMSALVSFMKGPAK